MVGLWSFLTSYLQPSTESSMDFTGYIYDRDNFNSTSMHDYNLESSTNPLDELPMTGNQTLVCPFLSSNHEMPSEWAYKAPVLLILACNMVFLVYIMTVSSYI